MGKVALHRAAPAADGGGWVWVGKCIIWYILPSVPYEFRFTFIHSRFSTLHSYGENHLCLLQTEHPFCVCACVFVF